MPTIAHTVFGLRTQPVDIEQQEKFLLMEKTGKVGELEGKIRKLILEFNANAITEEEYTKKRDQYFGQIEDILKE